MTDLGAISFRDFEKFLLYVGCTFKRQKGSHKAYWRSGLNRPIILVNGKEIPPHVIRLILKQLGISVDEFLAILKNL